jgi:hypothetical protein
MNKKYIFLILISLNLACQSSNSKIELNTEIESQKTINQNSILSEFYLGYDEWKTIRCIIASNEDTYWDKSMIGLIEKSGLLRIEYLEKTIHLKPLKRKNIEMGIWNNSFKNDTIQIDIYIKFDNKKGIMGAITGKGNIKGKIGNSNFSDKIFCVNELEK